MTRIQAGAMLQPHHKKAFATLAPLGQTPQELLVEKAKIGQIQAADGQLVLAEGAVVIIVASIGQPRNCLPPPPH